MSEERLGLLLIFSYFSNESLKLEMKYYVLKGFKDGQFTAAVWGELFKGYETPRSNDVELE